jgi:ketosteroid isomerase-like protein
MKDMPNDELKNEFEELGREWSDAIVSNDAGAIGRYMADDWLIVGETGFTSKNDFLALVASGDLTHEAMDSSVQSVRVYGDVAIVVGRGTNSGHYKAQPFTSDEWITDVFVKRDGRWLCVLTHLTAAVDRK